MGLPTCSIALCAGMVSNPPLTIMHPCNCWSAERRAPPEGRILTTVFFRVSILLSFTIYLIAGREIFRKRQQLRAFKDGSADSSFSSYKTTNVEITSSTAENPVPLENLANNFPLEGNNSRSGLDPYSTVTSKALDNRGSNSGKSYERYTVNIASSPIGHRRPSPHPHSSSGSFSGQTATQLQHGRAALDANTAAWGYTKVAILFFVSLLVTWVSHQAPAFLAAEPSPLIWPQMHECGTDRSFVSTRAISPLVPDATDLTVHLSIQNQIDVDANDPQVPSSVNRVYALVHPDKTNIPLAYVAGLVLSLMGFWNSVIYIFTSRAACKELFSGAASFRFWTRGGHPSSHIDEGDYLGERGSMTRQHQTRLSAAALGKDRTHVAVTPVLERGNSDRGGLPSPRTYSTLSRARVSFADEWERLEPEPERDTPMEGSQDGEEEGKRSRDAHVTAASVV